MTDWFTSDSHFFHRNILFYCPERAKLWGTTNVEALAVEYSRGYMEREHFQEACNDLNSEIVESVQHMTEGLINNWNSRIQPGDNVYHDGDFMMGSSANWEECLKRLNGNIHLVKGNHDYKFVKQDYVKERMVWIEKYYEMNIKHSESNKKQLIVMSHYPLMTWNDASRGSIMVHGHCHSSLNGVNETTTRIDVGVDNPICNYSPISDKELMKIMKHKVYQPVDHHGLR